LLTIIVLLNSDDAIDSTDTPIHHSRRREND
jgi:hypothetical protein